jgi:hypothetical protein
MKVTRALFAVLLGFVLACLGSGTNGADPIGQPNKLLNVTVSKDFSPNPAQVGQIVTTGFGLAFTKHTYHEEAIKKGLQSIKLLLTYDGGGGSVKSLHLMGTVPASGLPFDHTFINLQPGVNQSLPSATLEVEVGADSITVTGGSKSPLITSVVARGVYDTAEEKTVTLTASLFPVGAAVAAIGFAQAPGAVQNPALSVTWPRDDPTDPNSSFYITAGYQNGTLVTWKVGAANFGAAPSVATLQTKDQASFVTIAPSFGLGSSPGPNHVNTARIAPGILAADAKSITSGLQPKVNPTGLSYAYPKIQGGVEPQKVLNKVKLAVGLSDGKAQVWTPRLIGGALLTYDESDVKELKGKGNVLATSTPDLKLFAFAFGNTASVTNLDGVIQGKPIDIGAAGSVVNTFAYSGSSIAAGQGGKAFTFGSTNLNPNVLATIKTDDIVLQVAFSVFVVDKESTSVLGVLLENGDIKIYKALEKDLVVITTVSTGKNVNAFTFSPDGKYVAVAYKTGEVKIWGATADDTKEKATLQAP